MNMIKLLCVDHVTKILGGAEFNLLQLLERIDRRRFELLVACVADGTLDRELSLRELPRAHFKLSPVISEFRLSNQPLQLGRAIRSVALLRRAANQMGKIARQSGAQALLSITNKDHFAAGMAARRIGRPSIWWVNDIICRDFFSPATLHLFGFMARRYASRLVTVSEQGREALIDLGIAAEKITTIYNGIDPEIYRRLSNGSLRSLLGVPEDAPLVTILGRITPWKGQQVFVEMAAQIAEDRRDVHFLIVGGVFNEDQQFADDLRRQAAAAGLGDRLHFLEFRKDVTEIYSASDVVVHCSLKPEAFGRVIIEAMACEVPVVAASDGGVREIIEDGKNGFLVLPGDVSAYTQAVGALLAEPARARELGRHGRATVLARFSLDRMVSQFEALLSEAVIK